MIQSKIKEILKLLDGYSISSAKEILNLTIYELDNNSIVSAKKEKE